jgi:hypothetical protein
MRLPLMPFRLLTESNRLAEFFGNTTYGVTAYAAYESRSHWYRDAKELRYRSK